VSFEGFPEQALVFYEGLQADNTKAYWTDHKATYDACVKAPMEALLAQLEQEFGTGKLFRPYRDVRFSKDKTPYKEHAGAVVERQGGGAYYVQLDAEGLYVGGGFWHTQSDQVQRYRVAVAEDASGRRLVKVLAGLAHWQRIGDRLKRLPKPFEADHPRADLLHHKSLAVGLRFEPAEWLHTPECRERVAAAWREVSPLNAWLEQHVGRTHTPPRPRGG
jgi:uncharacterized protein (TIGR02453 family)